MPRGIRLTVLDKKLSLGSLLNQRRLDSRGKDWYFTQGDVADALGISQSQVGLYEKDRVPLKRKRPEDIYDLLRAYKFPEPQAVEIMQSQGISLLPDSPTWRVFKRIQKSL